MDYEKSRFLLGLLEIHDEQCVLSQTFLLSPNFRLLFSLVYCCISPQNILGVSLQQPIVVYSESITLNSCLNILLASVEDNLAYQSFWIAVGVNLVSLSLTLKKTKQIFNASPKHRNNPEEH